MFNYISKSIVRMTLMAAVFAFNVVAQDPDNFTTSDVVGMFANQGFSGAQAGLLTVSEAHRQCLSLTPSGEQGTSSYEGDYYTSYRTCMSGYVPFRVAGAGESGACGQTNVTWGQCSASVPAIADGTSFSARNTFNVQEYEGFANFQCSGGQLQYVSGGCSSVAQACQEGEVVEWGVTSPLWADNDNGTIFTDRFGVRRHSPKGNCFASMPSALSGHLITTAPTFNEMPQPDRYNFLASSSAQRCFNSEWLQENRNTDICTYVPRSCSATSYKHPGGCSYSIPTGNHDEVFVSNNPQPQNSIGGVQAHCWDGTWEIKSSSCALSCEPTLDSYAWDSPVASVNRQCQHGAKSFGQRLSPGSAFLLNNETVGMDGNVSYSCDNGTIRRDSEFCAPSSCGVISANSWAGEDGSICSHEALPGSLEHGEEVTRSVGDSFSDSLGTITYLCEYGETRVLDALCESDFSENICFAAPNPGPTPDPTPDPTPGPTPDPGEINICIDVGVNYDDNLCCYLNIYGEKRCYIIQ